MKTIIVSPIEESNRLIATFMNMDYKFLYRRSGKKDDKGVEILEGSIINADGYNSDLKEYHFHCVEYDKSDGIFGSNVYGDFDLLKKYNKIEVVGHVEDYRAIVNTAAFDWSGNFGAVFKDASKLRFKYHNDWIDLMGVVEKIDSLGYDSFIAKDTRFEDGELAPNTCGDSPEKVMKICHHMTITTIDNKTVATGKGDTKIKAVWSAIIEFVKWYNFNAK